MKYYLWNEGCQMNVADLQRVASALEHLGYAASPKAEDADVIVMNTCVVRQSAEDRAYGRLTSLRPIKKRKPGLVINLMGCLVGIKGSEGLRERFPYVDVFSPPSDPGPLIAYLTQSETHAQEAADTEKRFVWMDGDMVSSRDTIPVGDMILPEAECGRLVSAFIPVVYGCSHACTYCIIPYRRGVEVSRPPEEILNEARALVAQGVKEITLLGQIVDRYGKDEPHYPTLAGLLRQLHEIEGLERLRFLTSHPNWMSDELLDTVAGLPKLMPHIEIPAQAGDDTVLANMRRGYTAEQYRQMIARIRARIPGASIGTDIIVGFPGETEEQFQHTYDLLAELKMDVAHLARYSPREGTLSARRMADDVPDEEKWRRFRLLEELQEKIAAEIHALLLGETVEVLFEGTVRGRWRGRTPTNKLVFVASEADVRGQVRQVQITWTGPWSMQGRFL
jgi:tRNA-2-methylthio-N6-dimethylallyladenosine synthase